MLQRENSDLADNKIYSGKCLEDLKIIAIDDDLKCLERIEYLMGQVEGGNYIRGFTDPLKGIEYIKQHRIDFVLLAISMADIVGIDVARRIEKLRPSPAVAFVTKYRSYSFDAWRTNAVDYILKPIEKEELERAIGRARYYKLFWEIESTKNVSQKKILIKCFPSFEVLVDGVIVEFTNSKVKELLAFLIYQQGNWCTIDQIVFSVLEKQGEKSGKQYYRTLVFRLRKVLERYGIDFMLETGYGRARVRPLFYSCEYYEYLKGKKELFQGAFMGTYLWAEDAVAFMTRECNRI